ncbi:MAG: magnesium transporter, partial [Actinomycetota bacterium]|nr:magnesium transporter [Actinomycetota bacterium]
MPSFRPHTPSLVRPGGRARSAGQDESAPVSAAISDCAVYEDGSRLSGSFAPAAALQQVREV